MFITAQQLEFCKKYLEHRTRVESRAGTKIRSIILKFRSHRSTNEIACKLLSLIETFDRLLISNAPTSQVQAARSEALAQLTQLAEMAGVVGLTLPPTATGSNRIAG